MPSSQVTKLGIDELWRATRGAGIKVAVLDSGVNHSIALPADRVTTLESHGGEQAPTSSPHGTSCASLIGSGLEGADGIAPESRVLSIRTTTSNDRLSPLQVKRGLRMALSVGCDVISCSFTLQRVDHEMRDLVREAHLAGIPIIAACGNDPDDASSQFPELVPHAIVVGALSSGGAPMRGRHTIWTDIFCLGDELDVVDGKGAPFVWRGFSSGATAIVAGIVALALTPLPPAKRRTAGMALEGLLKATATRSVDASLEFGPSLKIEPQRLFRAIQELT